MRIHFIIHLIVFWILPATVFADGPLVIAHRGASGYVPEHTLVAKAMAHAMGADYIEQDVVLSKDDVPVVLHDIHLDTVTNVADVFPSRAREDGRFYAIDFTVAEIKQLNATERINLKTGQAAFPNRFPPRVSAFQVPTLEEEIALIQGLNKSTGREVGIYPELKAPAFHHREGKDLARIVLNVVGRFGYNSKDDLCFIQCFDIGETKRLRAELGCKLRVVQLMAGITHRRLASPAGLREVAGYADGVGPSLDRIIQLEQGKPQVTSFVADAHAAGLQVHPYTLRADNLPSYAASYEELVDLFYKAAKVDGAFTDFPDRTVAVLSGK